MAVPPVTWPRVVLAVRKMITPDFCFTMRLAAAFAVMNSDLANFNSGVINSSIDSSKVCLPPPYSLSLGPTELTTTSMVPACLTTVSRY